MEVRVGREGRRLGGGGRRALASKAANFSIQSVRLRVCDRNRDERKMSSPSRLSRVESSVEMRFRMDGVREGLVLTQKRSSALVLTLLTFWPPGPGLRSKEKCNSESGIERRDLICTVSAVIV